MTQKTLLTQEQSISLSPLFSGVAMKATGAAFVAKPVAKQVSMFGQLTIEEMAASRAIRPIHVNRFMSEDEQEQNVRY